MEFKVYAAGPTPFDPNTFEVPLRNLSSPAARQVRFKFGKAYGKIDGINLYGRKAGTSSMMNLGRFNATPARTAVPLSGDNPEQWEFQARAVKRDQEIGLPSAVLQATIGN